MNIEIIRGVLIPFLGTVLGSACVFFLRKNIGDLVQRALTGFAAGVMVAASIWSLLIPAMEQSAAMGKWSFVPAVAGFWVGILFLLLLVPGYSAGFPGISQRYLWKGSDSSRTPVQSGSAGKRSNFSRKRIGSQVRSADTSETCPVRLLFRIFPA